MKSIWLLFSCPGSGRQKHDLAGNFNLGGVWGGELKEFKDRKPQSVYKQSFVTKAADVQPEMGWCSNRLGLVVVVRRQGWAAYFILKGSVNLLHAAPVPAVEENIVQLCQLGKHKNK